MTVLVVRHVIYLRLQRCAYSWTSCAITRCREIMTPQLSIVKTRFAKASLRPRCARHRSWRATCRLPNGCVGHSASQWLRWTLSYPIHETDRRAISSVWQNTHPLQAASQHQMLYLSTSNNVAIFVAPIHLPTDTSSVPLVWQSLDSRLRRYRSCSRPFLLDQVSNTVGDSWCSLEDRWLLHS